MKILVPVKHVQTLDQDARIQGARIDPDSGEWELNEWDSFSLEAALQLAEGVEGSEVVVTTLASEDAQESLLACLANGADRAIRVDDEGLGEPDPLCIARVLAEVARRESPDLVLCGVQSSDSAHAATGVALAGLLDLAHVAVVNGIALEGGGLTVQRELEGGAVEVLRLALPALLTVQTGINEPRYATLRAIKQARSKPLQSISLADLGLSEADVQAARGARVRNLAWRDNQTGAAMLEGSSQEVAARILEILGETVR